MIRLNVPHSSVRALALMMSIGAIASAANADVKGNLPAPSDNVNSLPSRIKFIEAPPQAFASGEASNIIFLNRCNNPEAPCLVRPSSRNDATTNETSLIRQPAILSAFDVDGDDMTDPNSPENDAYWQAYFDCVKDIFSPYDIIVTDEDPGIIAHTEILTGGVPGELDVDNPNTPKDENIDFAFSLGVAAGTIDCTPYPNALVFVFANAHPAAYGNPTLMIEEMCSAAGQEAAHAFTLDHVGSCTDPMTYEKYCGVRKYFRNLDIRCGAFENAVPGFPQESPRDCKCGAQAQNAHKVLLRIFGASDTQPPPPSLTINAPSNGATIGAAADMAVTVNSLHTRGLNRIEVYLNGWLWGEVAGKSPEAQGTGTYTMILPQGVLNMPATVPNGVIDIEVRSYNDLEGTPATETITITKGAACTAPTDCAQGQLCDAGKCYWAEPQLGIGDMCEYNQACTSGSCVQAGDEMRCSQACNTFAADSCPADFECLDTGGSLGVCWPESSSGCCSAADTTNGQLAMQLAMALGLGAWLLRRRNRG